MILGEFNEDTGEPTILGFVYFPRLKESIVARVPFLLDTGASTTILHPKDARKLKVAFGKLSPNPPKEGVGSVS